MEIIKKNLLAIIFATIILVTIILVALFYENDTFVIQGPHSPQKFMGTGDDKPDNADLLHHFFVK